jgi:hypothetical protein
MHKNKKILTSAIFILAFLALGAAPAEATFFGDCGWSFWKPSCWNTFAKKKLDLQIDFAGYYNKPVDGHPNAGFWRPQDLTCQDFFNFDDIKPGDWGEGTISLHLKNQDAWGCLYIRPKKNDDKSSNEPELLEDEKNLPRDIWDGELAENMKLRIWADICKISPAKIGDNIYQENCDRLLYDATAPISSLKLTLADSAQKNIFTGKMESIKKNKDYFVGVDWHIPGSVGNIIQSDSYKADITFYVEQAEGNRSFKCK